MRSRLALAAAVLLAAAVPSAARAQYQLTEGFENVAGLGASGWTTINSSAPVGTIGWFQGNSSVFPAATGVGNAYVGVNYNSTTGANTISNWLLTPVLSLFDGAVFSFQTRTVGTPAFPDRLELRLSTGGASTNVGAGPLAVGDFSTLLLTVNPSLTTSGYPNAWTTFTATLSGIGAPTTGRLAFHYFVPNGGPSGANSDYIGVDDVRMTAAPSATVPEPATVALLATGLAGVLGVARRRRAA